jgi:hypothetical protein
MLTFDVTSSIPFICSYSTLIAAYRIFLLYYPSAHRHNKYAFSSFSTPKAYKHSNFLVMLTDPSFYFSSFVIFVIFVDDYPNARVYW